MRTPDTVDEFIAECLMGDEFIVTDDESIAESLDGIAIRPDELLLVRTGKEAVTQPIQVCEKCGTGARALYGGLPFEGCSCGHLQDEIDAT